MTVVSVKLNGTRIIVHIGHLRYYAWFGTLACSCGYARTRARAHGRLQRKYVEFEYASVPPVAFSRVTDVLCHAHTLVH